MKHDGQSLSGNCKKNFLHQDEALAGSETRDTAAGDGKTFAGACGTMFGFGFNES